MTVTTALSPASLLRRLRFERKMLAAKYRRFGRAWRYATDHLTEDDAFSMIRKCESVIGYHALETIGRDNVLEAAQDRWGDLPELEDLATEAAEDVADDWSSTDGVQENAISWALDKIADRAAERGIALKDLAA